MTLDEIQVSAADPWDTLDDDLKAVLRQRVAKMHPGKDAATFWQDMEAKYREEWIWHERHGDPITETWSVDEARIRAGADPATMDAFTTVRHEPHPYEGETQVVHLHRPTRESEALTELGLARRLVAATEGEARYAPELGRWFVYNGCQWIEDITGEIVRQAKAVVDALHAEAMADADRRQDLTKAWMRFQSASKIRAIVELAQTEPGVPVRMAEFDANPWALNVANGIIDLHTGELRNHDPAELHSKLVDIDHDPAAAAPRFDQFLHEVFADDALIGLTRRYAGYSLTGDVREQIFLFCYGKGANGKSALLAILRSIAGDYGLQLDPAVLTDNGRDLHPTGLTDLRGARLATTIETEGDRRMAEALVKQLTGGDPIRARRMRMDYFEFLPTHKLWFAGNHLPVIRGTDLGIWRRIALLPFEQTFEGDKADTTLLTKLAGERPGILAWALRGCLEWQRDGLMVPERVKAATAEYRTSQNHLGRFLDECCVLDEAADVTAAEIRGAYVDWCGSQGETPWTVQAVGRELGARGLDSTLKGTPRARTWLGIRLRSIESER